MKKDDLSEKAINFENCCHCDKNSATFKYYIGETANFHIICDPHPLIEGHILIIPKEHLSCIGEYPADITEELKSVYNYSIEFVKKNYGTVATFEHGIIGQTVFHSHIHLMPFSGSPLAIIPEGADKIMTIANISELKEVFKRDKKYLFFSIGEKNWIADVSLGAPRFFRDRFAIALGAPERGNWKEMHFDEKLMIEGDKECQAGMELWKKYLISNPPDFEIKMGLK